MSLSKRNGGGMKGWNWWSLDYSKRRGERRERGSLAFALFGVKFDSGREDTRNTGSEKRGWEGERGTLTWKERKAFKARWWLDFYLALLFAKRQKSELKFCFRIFILANRIFAASDILSGEENWDSFLTLERPLSRDIRAHFPLSFWGRDIELVKASPQISNWFLFYDFLWCIITASRSRSLGSYGNFQVSQSAIDRPKAESRDSIGSLFLYMHIIFTPWLS